MLAVHRYGHGVPAVTLHGFSLAGAQFEHLRLSGYELISPDLPGHGDSQLASDDPSVMLELVADAVDSHAPSAPMVGYSQGGRIALALTAMGLVTPRALVVVSATGGIDDAQKREIRSEADQVLARDILRHGLRRFVDQWTSTGLTSTTHLPEDVQAWDRSVRLSNTEDGVASALVGYGQGAMPSVWNLLGSIQIPTLIVTGRNDVAYTAIGVRLVAAIGANAELVTINGAGHNPFNDQPAATAAIIGGFLRQSDSMGIAEPDDQS